MRTNKIATGEIYHICNKSIEGRPIFSHAKECAHFLETMNAILTPSTTGTPSTPGVTPGVEVLAIALMPNHFHILMKQLTDNSIPSFMQRLCNSYSKYFNIRHGRKGPLFIGRYKAVHINSDIQARHIFTYIHANPLDLVAPKWRAGSIDNWQGAKKFILQYTWSSLGTYINNLANPLVSGIISKELAKNFYKNSSEHLSAIKNWSVRNNESHYAQIDPSELE